MNIKNLAKFNAQKIIVLVIACSYLILGFKFFRFIFRFSENVLVWDQWDIFDLIVKNSSIINIFLYQHNEHRIGVPLLITKVFANFTAWNTKYETILIGALIFASAVIALFLKRRLFGQIEIYDLIIPFLFLNLYQYENLVWGFQIGFVLPLLWLLLTVYLFTFKNSFMRNCLITIFSFLSAYSHFHGIFVGVISSLYFLINIFIAKGKKAKLIFSQFLIVNILIVLSYFVGYKSVQSYGTSNVNLVENLQFIFVQINGFWGNTSRNILNAFLPILTFLILGGLLLTFKKVSVVKNWPIASLIIFSLLFSFSTAYGRAGLGSEGGGTSRYMTLMIPMYLGIYFYLARIPNEKIKNIILPFVLMSFLFISVQNNFRNYQEAASRKTRLSNWKSCYLQKNDYVYCDNEINMTTYHSPEEINIVGKLEYLKENNLNFFK